ncbi:hypothetical protein LFU01_33390 [Lysinibacillus fusiformis]|nr:hypothetical protein LFU01_33390 [Lysinibacillus fusiformis]
MTIKKSYDLFEVNKLVYCQKFEGVMGSKLEVDILDVTNPANPMLVETRSY